MCSTALFSFFFFNDTATTEIYTLSLHDALPIFVVHHARLLLAGEPRAALQSVVRAAVAAVLSDAGGLAVARRALGAERRGRDPAEPVRRARGQLGAVALHALPDRRRAVARDAGHARPRLAAPRPRVRRDAGRVGAAGVAVRPRGGKRHVGRPGLAADAGPAADAGSRLVDAAHGVAGRGDLRGALVPGGPGRRARDRLPRPVPLAPHHGRRGRHARRRGDLLRLPLYR